MLSWIQKTVAAEFSAERARELTAAIHGYDRWSSFSQYHRCGNYCATRMREAGLEDVELMEVPADGATRFGDWTMPLAWDVEDASLQVIEPAGAARILAHYREEPACLAIWSAPTPPEGLVAEVVLLAGRNEEEYAQTDVVGKIVFTHQSHGQVRGWAARHGAVGFITDYPACEQDALADSVCWMNSWVDYHGWGYLKSDTPLWGFSLTREKGQYLERQFVKGSRVMARAVVKSCLYEGSFTVPTGILRGESDQEVLVYAHAYEYGAEDNASGCATVLEAARVLKRLVEKGVLPRPARTIRFMMSWECYGSIPWAVQRIYGRKNVVAGLCLDAFGGKSALTGGVIRVMMNSHCQASYTDYLAAAAAAACFQPEEGTPYELCPWSGGTDHTIFQDPTFDVPMPWLSEHPSRFHHTSLDEMDKIDVERLRLEGIYATTYLYALAAAGEAESAWLARGTRELWQDKVAGEAQGILAGLAAKDRCEELSAAWQDGQERLAYLGERGLAAIRSVERLGSTEKLRQNVEEQAGELQRALSYQLEGLHKAVKQRAQACGGVLAGPEKRTPPRDGADLVPRRLVPGLLTLCTIPLQERAEFNRVTHGESPMWSSVLIFGLFWADGRRNLGEIERLVRLEMGPTDIDLIAYFRFLQRLGYIAWVQS